MPRMKILSSVEQDNFDKPKEKLISAIASHSVICWEHMNLLGEYDFSDEKLKDSVGIAIKNNSLTAL